MTEELADPGGGIQEEPVANQDVKLDEENNKPDNVSWETHRKLLSEKKKLQESYRSVTERLSALEAEQQEKAKKELAEQNRWKELYEQEKEQASKYQTELQARDQQIESALKLDAFKQALGNKVIDRKYFGFIDTGKILLDPDSGQVDPTSVQREVERVQATYPEIIRAADKKPLPNEYPSGASSAISMEEWKKLPLKEMKARLPDIMKSR